MQRSSARFRAPTIRDMPSRGEGSGSACFTTHPARPARRHCRSLGFATAPPVERLRRRARRVSSPTNSNALPPGAMMGGMVPSNGPHPVQARAVSTCTGCGMLPDSIATSSRSSITNTLSNPSASTTSFRNVAFLVFDSTSTQSRSGSRIFSGSPGAPAPEPTSSITGPAPARWRSASAGSTKCRSTAVRRSRMAVRLMCWFQRSSSCKYREN